MPMQFPGSVDVCSLLPTSPDFFAAFDFGCLIAPRGLRGATYAFALTRVIKFPLVKRQRMELLWLSESFMPSLDSCPKRHAVSMIPFEIDRRVPYQPVGK